MMNEPSLKARQLVEETISEISPGFKEIENIRQYNMEKILRAFHDVRLGATDFHSATGYGYGDIGREKLERVFAHVFKAEDALVRPAIASGTHALALTMRALLRAGDELVYLNGSPYDTMQTVIGISGNAPGNYKEMGIHYRQIEMQDGHPDLEAIASELGHPRLAVIQRSSGYTNRPSVPIETIQKIATIVHEASPETILMVDNCYGELTETREPIEVGADIVAGSLIKNLGGGVAPGGGYVAGSQELINRVANFLTAPGLGKECGLMYDSTRLYFQGLYFAPHITVEAMKNARLMAKLFEKMGYQILAEVFHKQSDIVAVITLGDPDKIITFCKTVQACGALDAHVTPEPWDMPGYDNKIIMAAGGLIEGSSIELSADGPIRSPYSVYYQGGLTFEQGILTAQSLADAFIQNGWAKA